MKDETGKKYNSWKVKSFAYVRKRKVYWNCVCDCGEKSIVRDDNLKNGGSTQCKRCASRGNRNKRTDLVGQRFGRLVVKEFACIKKGASYWKCVCDCKNNVIVKCGNLGNGTTKSCGCYKKDRISETLKGVPLSKEHRQKLSENHADLSGEKNAMFGRFGKDHPTWNPNLTDEDRQDTRNYKEYNDWRKAVYKRDNYICQCCGKRNAVLYAHHIESYNSNPDFRTKVSNGITLCEKHHKDFHHIYGYGNNTRVQLNEFLKSITKSRT